MAVLELLSLSATVVAKSSGLPTAQHPKGASFRPKFGGFTPPPEERFVYHYYNGNLRKIPLPHTDMPYIDLIMRVLFGVIFTFILNKMLSIFRIRQLYVACYDILECREPGVKGFTASITIYNKGKDKEKSVEITIPDATLCQILSSSTENIVCEDNSFKIDRILPKEIISASIFFASESKPKSKKLTIRSEDTNGHAFWKKEDIPPSAGPAFAIFSALIVALTLMGYGALTQKNPSDLYNSIRYGQLLKQGFTPSIISDNVVISKTSIFSEKYPIQLSNYYKKDKNLVLEFTTHNPLENEIYASTHFSYNLESEYYEKLSDIRRIKDPVAQDAAQKELESKYYHLDPIRTPVNPEITLQPGETKTVALQIPITDPIRIKHIEAQIWFEGINNGEKFRDTYQYSAIKSPQKEDIEKLIQ